MRKARIQRALSMHASRLVLHSQSYMKWFTHAILEISCMSQRSTLKPFGLWNSNMSELGCAIEVTVL
jgi:hypothetical protein